MLDDYRSSTVVTGYCFVAKVQLLLTLLVLSIFFSRKCILINGWEDSERKVMQIIQTITPAIRTGNQKLLKRLNKLEKSNTNWFLEADGQIENYKHSVEVAPFDF